MSTTMHLLLQSRHWQRAWNARERVLSSAQKDQAQAHVSLGWQEGERTCQSHSRYLEHLCSVQELALTRNDGSDYCDSSLHQSFYWKTEQCDRNLLERLLYQSVLS